MEVPGDIGPWLLAGLVLAGVIMVLVPDGWIAAVSADKAASMGLMLLVGLPMYVCATASTPAAAALLLKGMDPGAVLVFLLAGPATNAATMTMVAGLLGRRALAVYLAAVGACSLGFGYLVGGVYRWLELSSGAAAGVDAGLPPLVGQAAAGVLMVVLAVALFRRRSKAQAAAGACRCRGADAASFLG